MRKIVKTTITIDHDIFEIPDFIVWIPYKRNSSFPQFPDEYLISVLIDKTEKMSLISYFHPSIGFSFNEKGCKITHWAEIPNFKEFLNEKT
jgi:hypothetical protein